MCAGCVRHAHVRSILIYNYDDNMRTRRHRHKLQHNAAITSMMYGCSALDYM